MITPYPIYLINLASAVARRRRCEELFAEAGLAVSRFEAISAEQLTPAEIARVYDASRNARTFKQAMTPAEIACYISHLRLWERIEKQSAPAAFVFEDDVEPAVDLATIVKSVEQRSRDWDMLKLFSSRRRALLDPQGLIGPFQVGVPNIIPMSTIGYAITRECAGRLRRKLVPFARPIDMDLKHWWEHGECIKLIEPSPLAERNGHRASSHIHQSRRRQRGVLSISRLVRHVQYHLRFRTNAMRHRKVRAMHSHLPAASPERRFQLVPTSSAAC